MGPDAHVPDRQRPRNRRPLIDLQAKKALLRKIPHGLYVVGVKQGDRLNAFTGSWLTQVSFTPPLIALGVKKDAHSLAMIETERVFTINFLGKGQKALAEHFVKPASKIEEKLSAVKYRLGKTGTPILAEGMGYVECEVREIANAQGDHAVVIAEVIEAALREDGPALTIMDTGWHYGG